jgi:ankyrin repeat protein
MPQTKSLPARPNLEFLKKLAKKRVRESRGAGDAIKLAAAQLAVAREHGFASWRQLHEHVTDVAAKPAKTVAWKPVMDAAYVGDVEGVRRALKAGADPNVLSPTGHRHRPLHRAIEPKKTRERGEKHDEVVRVLLDAGADPALRGTFSNVTALQLAATGEFRFVPLLRKALERLDIFHAAACADAVRVAELLKGDKSPATAQDVNGMTALHYCCASSAHKLGKAQSDALVRIAKMLLKAGADPNGKWFFDGKWPLTALYHATGQQNHVALAKLLLDAGASPYDGESIYHSVDEGHVESLELLTRYTSKKELADECTKAMCNLLHWNHNRGVPWLLAHGADPNWLHDKLGNSALHEAIKRRASDDVIRLLLEHGADPKLKNKDGLTAIQLARQSETRLPNRPCPTGRDGPERSAAKSKAAARMLALLEAKPKGGRR